MSDDKDTKRLGDDDESLAGDALLHAVRRDMLGLFKALDEKFEALDKKVEARLRDTTPMWEVAVSRLDGILGEQESQGRRLNAIEQRLGAIEAEQESQGRRLSAVEQRLGAIEAEQESQGKLLAAIEAKLERLDVIEGEIRQFRGRNERMIGELSRDVVEARAAQHDLEDRLEKLEKTPA